MIMLWALLRAPAVQTALVKKVTQIVTEKTGLKIDVGKVRVRLNKNLIIRDLVIYDTLNEPMIVIERIEAGIKNIELNSKNIRLELLEVKRIEINAYQTDSNRYNYSFFLDLFESDNPQPFDWTLSTNKFKVSRLKGLFTELGKEEQAFGLNIEIDSVLIQSDVIALEVVQSNFNVNGHQIINNLKFDAVKSGRNIELTNFLLLTLNSYADIPMLKVNLADSVNPLFYNTSITTLKVQPSDFSPIFEKLSNINTPLSLEGDITGSGRNLKVDNLKLHIGTESVLYTTANLINIADTAKFSYNFNINYLVTNSNAIDQLLKEYLPNKMITLPTQVYGLGEISYSGMLNMKPEQLVSKGQFISNAGIINTDLLVTFDQNKSFTLAGNVSSHPMNLNVVLNNSNSNSVNLSASVNGNYTPQKGINLDIDGYVTDLELDKFGLDSVTVKGKVTKKEFSGRISSFDPKLRFDFEGRLNMDQTDTSSFYDFNTSVYYANLFALSLSKTDTNSNLSVNINAKFTGNSFDNSNGTISITDLYYFKDTSYLATDTISISATSHDNLKEIKLSSEYLEGRVFGQIKIISFLKEFKNVLSDYLPAITHTDVDKGFNQLNFEIVAKYPHPVTEMLMPQLRIAPGTNVSGYFSFNQRSFFLQGNSQAIQYGNKKLVDLTLKLFHKNDKINVNMQANDFYYTENSSIKNLLASFNIQDNSITTNINWNNWLQNSNSGNLNFKTTLLNGFSAKQPYINFEILPSNVVVLDTMWTINRCSIIKDSAGISVNKLFVSNGSSEINIDGTFSKLYRDSIYISVDDINLNYLNSIFRKLPVRFDGQISGKTYFSQSEQAVKIISDLKVKNLAINHKIIGDTKILTSWDEIQKRLIVDLSALNNNKTSLTGKGHISPKEDEIQLNVEFKDQPVEVLEAFLQPTLDNISGFMSGKVELSGKLSSPYWFGSLVARDFRMLVTSTNVYYNLNDTIYLKQNSILFKNTKGYDDEGNFATVNGFIKHRDFIDWDFGLKVKTDKILGFNPTIKESPFYYGKVYGKGEVNMTGLTTKFVINVVATTLPNTIFYLPLESKSELNDNDFIEFINPYPTSTDKKKISKNTVLLNESPTSINLDLTVTPDAEVQILFDPRIGDALKANGNAKLNIESKGSYFAIFGDYNIEQGQFTFTLQNVINKKLDIQQNSTIQWNGDPLDADLNLDAVYPVKRVSVYDLTLNDADKEKKVEVNCHLLMTNKLVNPNISFSIDAPSNTNSEAIEQINSLPEGELNKQVLSLLLIRKFQPLPGLIQGNVSNNNNSNFGATTATELLSNQMSRWLSQVSNDFDLGVAYRPGDSEYNEQQVEVALSTKLMNDRVLINGNVAYTAPGSQPTTSNSTSAYTTDFQLEVKLNKKGNIRAKAFQKINNDIIYTEGPYTQGVGLFYTEEFDNFDELMQKMFRKSSARKPEEPNIKSEAE